MRGTKAQESLSFALRSLAKLNVQSSLLGKRSSHEAALKAVDALLKRVVNLLVETTSHVEAALAKFKEQTGAVSLTDCIVMALADHYSTKDIYGCNKQFEDAGYHRSRTH